MVSAAVAKSANANLLPNSLPQDFTAVFIGATSGIGRSALEHLATVSQGKSPRLYVIGRNATAAAPLLASLRQANPSASVEFIEKDVSLVKSVDEVASIIKKNESKVDLLFLSPGFLPFEGRRDTKEGLEPSMTTRYYSRTRAIQLLLPLLNASPNPHVTNILAGGQESPLLQDDLDLVKPGNFSFIQASKHSATMLTLMLEKFATENPKISFVHSYPGFVATPTLTRGTSGILAVFMRWVISPILTTLFAESESDAGAKALLYLTNAAYTVPETESLAAPAPKGLAKVQRSRGGVFLLNKNGETSDNEQVLGELRTGATELVWKHTTGVFDRVTK